jgi:serine/threonine-protein kinase
MSAEQSREEVRRELFLAAKQSFQNIAETLRRRVLEAAPATRAAASNGGLTLQLGDGALVIDPVQAAPADCLAAFEYEPAFDVIAYTAIAARKPRDRYNYEGRAHSLWFCDAHDQGVYRWYELAFMVQPLIAQRYTLDPFALPPTDEGAAAAFTPVMHIRQVAWQPIPFDQGEEEHFIERWLGWLAAAADGSLNRPLRMPENSGGRYRSPRRRQRMA